MTASWFKVSRLAAALLVFAATLQSYAAPALAWPTDSPSARQAAHLKAVKPPGWLGHYLPDDRYKIAGGVWKVVSTQTDKYYHRPDCSEMLRQSANTVIGFASVADANDAGYIPDPLCRPDQTTASFQHSLNGSALPAQTVAGIHGRRIILSDGASSVLLPLGWKRANLPPKDFAPFHLTIDVLTDGTSRMEIMVLRGTAQAGLDIGTMLTPALLKQSMAKFGGILGRYENSTSIPLQDRGNIKDAKAAVESDRTEPFKLSGWNGVRMLPAKGEKKAGAPSQLVMLGSKSKLVWIADYSGSKASNAIIKSLQPR